MILEGFAAIDKQVFVGNVTPRESGEMAPKTV